MRRCLMEAYVLVQLILNCRTQVVASNGFGWQCELSTMLRSESTTVHLMRPLQTLYQAIIAQAALNGGNLMRRCLMEAYVPVQLILNCRTQVSVCNGFGWQCELSTMLRSESATVHFTRPLQTLYQT